MFFILTILNLLSLLRSTIPSIPGCNRIGLVILSPFSISSPGFTTTFSIGNLIKAGISCSSSLVISILLTLSVNFELVVLVGAIVTLPSTSDTKHTCLPFSSNLSGIFLGIWYSLLVSFLITIFTLFSLYFTTPSISEVIFSSSSPYLMLAPLTTLSSGPALPAVATVRNSFTFLGRL